jgi:hypothetical protein
VAGCFECGDETSVSNATELVSITGQKYVYASIMLSSHLILRLPSGRFQDVS